MTADAQDWKGKFKKFTPPYKDFIPPKDLLFEDEEIEDDYQVVDHGDQHDNRIYRDSGVRSTHYPRYARNADRIEPNTIKECIKLIEHAQERCTKTRDSYVFDKKHSLHRKSNPGLYPEKTVKCLDAVINQLSAQRTSLRLFIGT